jgi:hypothetical protein
MSYPMLQLAKLSQDEPGLDFHNTHTLNITHHTNTQEQMQNITNMKYYKLWNITHEMLQNVKYYYDITNVILHIKLTSNNSLLLGNVQSSTQTLPLWITWSLLINLINKITTNIHTSLNESI